MMFHATQGKLSPMLFWDEMKDSNSPPSYTEAINLPAPVKKSTSVKDTNEELRPKLCRMEKTSAGYGFHLNGVDGLHGQYITEVRTIKMSAVLERLLQKNLITVTSFQVVKGGAADKAGLENDDIVIEVNGQNIEQSTHAEVVEIIRRSGDTLEMLVASKDVYQQLKAKGVNITPLLLGEISRGKAHTRETPEPNRQEKWETKEEAARPETPPHQEKHRVSGAICCHK